MSTVIIDNADFSRPSLIHYELPDAVNETLKVSKAAPLLMKKKNAAKKYKAEAKLHTKKRLKSLEKNSYYLKATTAIERANQPVKSSIGPARELGPYETWLQDRHDKLVELRFDEMYTKAYAVTKDAELAKNLAYDPRRWSEVESAYKDKSFSDNLLLASAIIAPEFTIPAYIGGKAVDFGTFALSDGKYRNFGNMMENKFGIPEGYGDLFNPGYAAGGTGGFLASRPGLITGAAAAGKQFVRDYATELALGGAPVLMSFDDGEDGGSGVLSTMGTLAAGAGLYWGGKKGFNWWKNRRNSSPSTSTSASTPTSDTSESSTTPINIPHYKPKYGLFTWEHPFDYRDRAIRSSVSKSDLMDEYNRAIQNGDLDNFYNKYNLFDSEGNPYSLYYVKEIINDGSLITNYHNNVLQTGVVVPTSSQENWMMLRNTGRVLTGLGAVGGAGYGVYKIIDGMGNELSVVVPVNPETGSTDLNAIDSVVQPLNVPTAADSAAIRKVYEEAGEPLPEGWEK